MKLPLIFLVVSATAGYACGAPAQPSHNSLLQHLDVEYNHYRTRPPALVPPRPKSPIVKVFQGVKEKNFHHPIPKRLPPQWKPQDLLAHQPPSLPPSPH